MTPADDKANTNRDLNLRNDYGIVVDANGLVLWVSTSLSYVVLERLPQLPLPTETNIIVGTALIALGTIAGYRVGNIITTGWAENDLSNKVGIEPKLLHQFLTKAWGR